MDENNRAFFPITWAVFLNLQKKGRGDLLPLLPTNFAPDASSDIRMHPKTIANISHQNFKVRLSPSKKIYFYLHQLKPFKNDEKCFLFHLKSFFCSQDI